MNFVIRNFVASPERPVLLVALEGWIDAGRAAEVASQAIAESLSTETYATFLMDELLDLRSRRPRQLVEAGTRQELTWEEPKLLVGRDANGAGLALLIGPEPDYRWKAFAKEICGLAVEMGARLVVNLGGFPAASTHTRPVRLAATASNADLARQIGFVSGALDVPAGIADAIGAECSAAGIPSVGLWARVPHYVANLPFAPASLALVEGLTAISGLVLEMTELQRAAEQSREMVDNLIASSPEHLEMVRELETQMDELEGTDPGFVGSLPSGDEIAAELERFLRGEFGIDE